ncbi:MAG: ABC transporter permease [Oscillospiraceae bacterium]|nr:ABC transporter permease [Oscillospiraceae bacterium]
MNINIASIISRTLISATPLVITAVGGLFGEKAGIVNIGLDGNMLIGAFTAAIVSYYTGNAWIGLLSAVAACTLIALLHAYLCITVRLDHVISGLAVNTLAGNLTVYLLDVFFSNKGNSPIVPQLPHVTVPLLSELPAVGSIFTNMSIITLLMPFIVLAGWYLQYRVPFGMRVIAAGNNPQAARAMGVDVGRVQYASVLLGGVCCGFAGAFLSISYMNMFVRNMVAGRGYIAIAAILFGNYKPGGVALAGLFFGFVDAIQIALQGTIEIPNEFIQCIPYVLTILAVAYVMTRKNTPLRAGKKKGKI